MADAQVGVKSYTRKTKSGKVVQVKSYNQLRDQATELMKQPGRPQMAATGGQYGAGRSVPFQGVLQAKAEAKPAPGPTKQELDEATKTVERAGMKTTKPLGPKVTDAVKKLQRAGHTVEIDKEKAKAKQERSAAKKANAVRPAPDKKAVESLKKKAGVKSSSSQHKVIVKTETHRSLAKTRKSLQKELDSQGLDEMAPIRGVVGNYKGTHKAISRDEQGNITGAIDFAIDRNAKMIAVHDVRVNLKRQGIGQELLKEVVKSVENLPNSEKYEMLVFGAITTAIPWYIKTGATFVPWSSVGTWSPEKVLQLRAGKMPPPGKMMDHEGNELDPLTKKKKSEVGLSAVDKLQLLVLSCKV